MWLLMGALLFLAIIAADFLVEGGLTVRQIGVMNLGFLSVVMLLVFFFISVRVKKVRERRRRNSLGVDVAAD